VDKGELAGGLCHLTHFEALELAPEVRGVEGAQPSGGDKLCLDWVDWSTRKNWSTQIIGRSIFGV